MTGWMNGSRQHFDDAHAGRVDAAYAPPGVVECSEGRRDEPGSNRDDPGRNIERLELLRSTIEAEIIPRLMFASRSASLAGAPKASGARAVRRHDVVELTGYLLDGDIPRIAGLVGRLIHDGATQSTVLLDLFAPAARHLGELWDTDVRNFSEITMAMGCLQQALHIFDAPPTGSLPFGAAQRTIFLTPYGGEQHYFGVQLLDALFSRAGWHVTCRLAFDSRQANAFLSKRHVDVLGLSISRESLLDQLGSDIEALRRKSRNRELVVLVGGRVFVDNPELVDSVGADATAEDADAAVALADKLASYRAAATP